MDGFESPFFPPLSVTAEAAEAAEDLGRGVSHSLVALDYTGVDAGKAYPTMLNSVLSCL
jgi:hypothetical protein